MERDRISLADLPQLSDTLLELARARAGPGSGGSTITYASRHTIRDHLKALVDQRHLILHGAGRSA